MSTLFWICYILAACNPLPLLNWVLMHRHTLTTCASECVFSLSIYHCTNLYSLTNHKSSLQENSAKNFPMWERSLPEKKSLINVWQFHLVSTINKILISPGSMVHKVKINRYCTCWTPPKNSFVVSRNYLHDFLSLYDGTPMASVNCEIKKKKPTQIQIKWHTTNKKNNCLKFLKG